MGKPKKQVVDVLSMLASEDGEQVPPAKIEEMLSGKSDTLVDLFAKDLGYEGDSFSKQYGGAYEPEAPTSKPATKADKMFGKIKPLLQGGGPNGEFEAGGKTEADQNRTIEQMFQDAGDAVRSMRTAVTAPIQGKTETLFRSLMTGRAFQVQDGPSRMDLASMAPGEMLCCIRARISGQVNQCALARVE